MATVRSSLSTLPVVNVWLFSAMPSVGGGPKVSRVASPKQVAVARTMQAQARIFPVATLNFDRIRKLDADVRIALKVDPTEFEACLPPVAEVVTSHGWAQLPPACR